MGTRPLARNSSAEADPFLAATGEAAAEAAREPNWWTPNDLAQLVGAQFEREHGVDRALAAGLLSSGGSHQDKLIYLHPHKRLIKRPDRTVIGMMEAGSVLAEAIKAGDTIATFADYDPDGTTGMEAFRLAIAPYMSDPCSGCNGKKGADCFKCGGTGKIFRHDRFLAGYADAQRGFGLTDEFVREAAAGGAKILVTLDCGSTQSRQVALAQKLGMKVIVVDHHNVDYENPADYHLNPHLHGRDDEVSGNTGAQLAWKLGAAVQMASENSGRTRDEHWGRAMYLAGFGCRADMGSTTDLEHRAFFRVPMKDGDPNVVPPGLALLSERLGEDPMTPAGGVLTSAALNLAKRTPLVSAADVGALLACPSAAQAEPLVDKLVAAYETAKPWRKAMIADATAQVADVPENQRVAMAVLDGEDAYRDYCGYTGSVASDAARACGRPVICFAPKGEDPEGRTIYKWSMRTPKIKQHIGELIANEAMREACTLEQVNESGEVERAASVGGHPDVVSGSCYADQIPRVHEVAESWAQSFKPFRWFPEKWSGPEAYLVERRVPADRLDRLEEQAAMLAPFSNKDRNRKPQISSVGRLRDLAPDPENPRYMTATLDLGKGVERKAMIFADAADTVPEGDAEFVLELGEKRPYFIRNWVPAAA